MEEEEEGEGVQTDVGLTLERSGVMGYRRSIGR